MAIEDIFKALEEQADRDCREILDAAKTQAKAIEADAKSEGDRIKSTKLESVESNVKVKAGQITNAARLANKREVSAAKDRGIGQVYDEVLGKLAAMRGSKEYENLFKALAEEAVAGISGDVVVQVAPADAKLAAKVLAGLPVKGTVDATLDTVGGLTVIASGGRVFRRNTFESRLEKVKATAQAEVAEILFA
jgi:vacuolar-type H+-ATPase subunit E/Vma4